MDLKCQNETEKSFGERDRKGDHGLVGDHIRKTEKWPGHSEECRAWKLGKTPEPRNCRRKGASLSELLNGWALHARTRRRYGLSGQKGAWVIFTFPIDPVARPEAWALRGGGYSGPLGLERSRRRGGLTARQVFGGQKVLNCLRVSLRSGEPKPLRLVFKKRRRGKRFWPNDTRSEICRVRKFKFG